MTWQPIATAPKDRFIDVVAKIWLPHNDKFLLRRFPNCRWYVPPPDSNTDPHWSGLDKGWRAVYWMEIPAIPDE